MRCYLPVMMVVCLLILSGFGSTVSAIELDTIVGAWLMDEGAGDTVKDSSKYGHDGQINGGAKWVDGKFGEALEFKGAQWVSIPSTPELQIGDQLTMMAWFFAKDISTWRQLIAKSDEYLLRIDPPQEGNRMSAFVKAQGNWEPRASAFVPKKEEWIHFAATYDAKPKENANHLKVYVNGVQSGSSTRPGKVAPTVNPVEIGRWGGGSYFVGIIDEIAIFNVVLSEKEIQSVMNLGLEKILTGGADVKPSGKLTTQWGALKRRMM